jgi:SAM-dependent methyltransferase
METPADWWRTFFSGPVVESWLRMPTEAQTEEEATFIQESIGAPPSAWILDVPCGGGRHSRALAARGYDVTGVDISEQFLDAARAHPVAGPGSVTWVLGEMRDLPWHEQYHGAFCFGNCFGYLDDRGNAEFLQAVARTLRPGARFVLDTSYVVELVLPALQPRAWYEAGDLLMLSDRRYDHAEGRLHVEYTWIQDGKFDRRPMSARLFTYREVFRLLEEAGFGDLKGYGSLTREPFRMGSGRLLVVAEKRGA